MSNNYPTIPDTIVNAIARAWFVSAWASKQEEKGRSFSGQELMDVAPKTPRHAREAALIYLGRLECANKRDICGLLHDAAKADYATAGITDGMYVEPDGFVGAYTDSEYARTFGHYIGMEALGHGVSWFDDHAEFELIIPRTEYYV